MKFFTSILFCFFIIIDANANNKPNIDELDKLDMLDQQSKEFFKAITGLEKDYLEEQLNKIEDNNKKKEKKQDRNPSAVNNMQQNSSFLEKTKEEKEKEIFQHQTEMAQLTDNFTRTKQLKDLQIKSIYQFNGKNYVILKLDKTQNRGNQDELSANIEGRFKRGDYILGHSIVSINKRTKSIKLYKKLDDEFGYYIYLNNYGINVSDLVKIEEKKPVSKVKKTYKRSTKNHSYRTKVKNNYVPKQNNSRIQDGFSKINTRYLNSCTYTVKVSSLNVRNQPKENAKILRVLKQNDKFTIQKIVGNWLKLDTIYKYLSGDTMPVQNQSNWVEAYKSNVQANKSNCL